MKRKNSKINYGLWWILLIVGSALLVFCLLVSFGVISWRSEITVLQYIMCGMGLLSAVTNIRFWKKKVRESDDEETE